jgi:hypothetical protein
MDLGFTILSIAGLIFIIAYLIITREKEQGKKTPTNFGIVAIASIIVGIILGFSEQRGWGYAFIAHGALGMVIGVARLYFKKPKRNPS